MSIDTQNLLGYNQKYETKEKPLENIDCAFYLPHSFPCDIEGIHIPVKPVVKTQLA